jgi:hypothetical protein
MLFEKPKRKTNVFQDELFINEEMLWSGKPVASRIFTVQDLFLIPFALLWCAFLMSFWGVGFPNLFILPHTLAGIYMLFGRFVVKFWRKQHTYYAVTNQRLLIMSTNLGHHLQSYDVTKLPAIKKSVGIGDVGSIVFGVEPEYRWWQKKQSNMSNTGMEMFGYSLPGFYDIQDTEEVYRMITQLAHQTTYAWGEKAKPAYLPR